MMACFVYFTLLLGELFLISSGEGVTFCVKPTESGSCLDRGCQKCDTLQHYFDNVNETINMYDNVTLVFMSGTHNFCLSDYFNFYTVPIATEFLKMTGENRNVTVKDVCFYASNLPEDYCLLAFLQSNSTLFVENITFVNYICIWFSEIPAYSKQENAANVILKDCLFQDSSLTFKKLIAEECIFSNSVVSTINTAEIMNCMFSNSRLLAEEDTTPETQILLESCHICESYVYISTGSVTIVGNTYISSSNAVKHFMATFYIRSSNAALSGNVTFMNNIGIYGGAMQLESSILNITAGANVAFINNTASIQGGAIYLFRDSRINVAAGANLTFVNNSAFDKGGAIYIHPGVTATSLVVSYLTMFSGCIFSEAYSNFNNYSEIVHFSGNKAAKGGDDVYGASLFACGINSHSSGTSSAASDPLKVCLCESPFKPQCNGAGTIDVYHNFANMSLKVYPGESFTVPIFLVGLDRSTTTGVVYTYIFKSEHSTGVKMDSNPENGHVISNNKQCTSMNYSLSTNYTSEVNVTMYFAPINFQISGILSEFSICDDDDSCYGASYMSIFINITLLPCPPGFTLNGHCDCYLHYFVFDNCMAVNKTGLFSWSSNAWASIYEDGIIYDTHCPFDYCNITGQPINLLNDSDTQCAFNRAGRLCGGCRENYSLAIGSSHCIQCPNNNNLALVIFFAAAGFILVFFITALNLTVSQGMINGLIFYANIVWTYQSIFFPPHQQGYVVMAFFKTFIAWVNLDFGIETCFISGLTAFWKTWLQFVFPFYIWVIAGLIIVASRYSTRLTNLLGNRAVPVLNTLFLLSYVKLLRVAVTALLKFSYLKYTDQNSTVTHSVVWSVDGNLTYFGYPHILLFLAGLATLVVLCLPYTMLLLLMQWLRKLPHCKLTNWIMRFHPVYDAYFAPLKHKHQYWFGVLLLARVALLMTFLSALAIDPYVNLLLLLVPGMMLLFHVAVVQPYTSTAVLWLDCTFLSNLILLALLVLVSLWSIQPTLRIVAVGLSTGVAFVQFCGIVLYNVIEIIKRRCQCLAVCCNYDRHNVQEEDINEFVDNCDRRPGGSDVYFTTPFLNNAVRNIDTKPTY